MGGCLSIGFWQAQATEYLYQQRAMAKASPLDASLPGIQATRAMKLPLSNAPQIQIPVGKAYHTALQQLLVVINRYFGTTVISPLPVHLDADVTHAILSNRILGDHRRFWIGALFFGG